MHYAEGVALRQDIMIDKDLNVPSPKKSFAAGHNPAPLTNVSLRNKVLFPLPNTRPPGNHNIQNQREYVSRGCSSLESRV